MRIFEWFREQNLAISRTIPLLFIKVMCSKHVHLLCLLSARSALCLNSRRCVPVFTCPDGSFIYLPLSIYRTRGLIEG